MFQGKVGLREAVKCDEQGDCLRQRPMELQFGGIREYARTQTQARREARQGSVLATMWSVAGDLVDGLWRVLGMFVQESRQLTTISVMTERFGRGHNAV
ncbi:MAG: hypothetical protein JXA21_05020 [Anaerolineae bacterium]|nr:hypothetical protein [Anaerolineae bacterium]